MSLEPKGAGPLRLTTVGAMLQSLELNDIQFYKLSIKYTDREDDEVSYGTVKDVGVDVTTSIRQRKRGIDYRLKFSLPYPNGRVEADAGAIFDSVEPVVFEDNVARDFGDAVAMTALFPYIRQAVNDLGLRVGVPIVMPLLKQGELSFHKSSKRAAEGGED